MKRSFSVVYKRAHSLRGHRTQFLPSYRSDWWLNGGRLEGFLGLDAGMDYPDGFTADSGHMRVVRYTGLE